MCSSDFVSILQISLSVFDKLVCVFTCQSYWEITSDKYFDFIKDYVVGIGPWKDTIDPVVDNYIESPTDLVARAHAYNLQVCLQVPI